MATQIIVRSRDREAYLNSEGQWSSRIEQALQFDSARKADDFCRLQNLSNVEIIVRQKGRPPLRIPIRLRQK